MKLRLYEKLWAHHGHILPRLDGLQERIAYKFVDVTLLYEALTHRSALMELATGRDDPLMDLPWNERLEFLGDSVLGLCISSQLMERGEGFAEGDLSRIRASLVNEHALAVTARPLELGGCMILGRGEDRNGGRTRESLLADGFEALIGAVFLDGGFDSANRVVAKLFESRLNIDLTGLVQTDFKTMLQEITQERFKETPVYEVLGEAGPDHLKSFEVVVKLGDKELGRGMGASKKRASQAAAQVAVTAIVAE